MGGEDVVRKNKSRLDDSDIARDARFGRYISIFDIWEAVWYKDSMHLIFFI